MKTFIYGIKNIINNKIYIGSTKSFSRRKYSHFSSLKQNKHHSIHLQRSYNKYGKDNFLFFLIEECDSSIRKKREIYHINYNNSFNRNFGYNVYEPNGEKFSCSVETKQNISNSTHHSNLKIPIDMYDLLGNFLKSYESVHQAAKDNNFKAGIIFEIIHEKRKTYKNRYFILKGKTYNYTPSNKQRNMTKFYN